MPIAAGYVTMDVIVKYKNTAVFSSVPQPGGAESEPEILERSRCRVDHPFLRKWGIRLGLLAHNHNESVVFSSGEGPGKYA